MHHEIAPGAVHSQSPGAHGLQVGPACDKHHILAGLGEAPAKVAAGPSGADYRDAHGSSRMDPPSPLELGAWIESQEDAAHELVVLGEHGEVLPDRMNI